MHVCVCVSSSSILLPTFLTIVLYLGSRALLGAQSPLAQSAGDYQDFSHCDVSHNTPFTCSPK